jgi:iron-sulfur cluster assembly accessory protein
MFQITLSDGAVTKLKELISKNGTAEDTYLRVYVAGGGCSGFRYGLALDNKVHEGDEVVTSGPVKVVIDPTSKEYLDGSSVDYVESVAGSGFMVSNPNNWSTCGCGQSFNPKGEEAPDAHEGHGHAHAHSHEA